jgi:hypothetical protein
MTTPIASRLVNRQRWPCALLALALVWIALVRVPLILNADSHLDSDLAVDGLTLLEATHGHWRWHYPGTPHMGTLPLVLSWPQASFWGVNPITLVSGGLVAYELAVVATFLLAWRVYGPLVASAALVPFAFASTGTIWLAGRITGGHLLTLAWHVAAYLIFFACLRRPAWHRTLLLGLWCGLGLYLDQMFLMTMVSLSVVAMISWLADGARVRMLLLVPVFLAGFAGGYSPHELGRRIEPHDAYHEQFQPVFSRGILRGHSHILLWDCLPRLIAGHRLPGFESEPAPRSASSLSSARRRESAGLIAMAITTLTLTLFVISSLLLTRDAWQGLRQPATDPDSRIRGAIGLGFLLSSIGVVAGFVVNRNIFNSDNYRYLILLLVPWALGFGLLIRSLAKRGTKGKRLAWAIVAIFAVLATLDSARWYHRFGWINDSGIPRRRVFSDPALEWLSAHPEVSAIYGSYWDVYRLSLLSGGKVRGVPYPIFPNRFPEWSRSLPRGRPRVLLAGPTTEGVYFRNQALSEGGRIIAKAPGVTIVDWP